MNSAERGGHYRLRTESETKQKNKWKTNSFFFFLSLSLSLFPTKPRPVRRRKQRRSDSIRYNSLNETIQLTWNENENEQKQIGQSWSSIKWNFQKNNKENGPSKLKQFSKTCFEHQVKKKKKSNPVKLGTIGKWRKKNSVKKPNQVVGTQSNKTEALIIVTVNCAASESNPVKKKTR